MEITCLKNHLKEAVGICEKISSKNTNLPILNNILLDADGRFLKIIATNLELGIQIEIPAKVVKSGKLTVPASVINGLLANISGGDNLTLEAQNNNLVLLNDNNSILIKSQSSEDFPVLPNINSNNPIQIAIEDFVLGLKSVWYACSFSNIKPEISSVYLSSSKNTNLTFAATDSFRLAEKKFNYFIQDLDSILIPFKTSSEIFKIFSGKTGKAKILFDKNQINIEIDNIKFVSRLVAGVFPDYQQIIPKKFITDVVIDKENLFNSLKMAGIFSSKLNELNIFVKPENSFMSIKTSNNDTGEYTAKIPAKITGEELKISFNYKYIADCLPNFESSEIILRFSGEEKPLFITGTKETSFQYLVMPMSI